jgi:hypothetical protein
MILKLFNGAQVWDFFLFDSRHFYNIKTPWTLAPKQKIQIFSFWTLLNSFVSG